MVFQKKILDLKNVLDKASKKENIITKKKCSIDYQKLNNYNTSLIDKNKEKAKKIENMTDSEYFSIPYYSASAIKTYDQNPELINYKRTPENPHIFAEKKESKAMLMGSLVHKAILEPLEFAENRSVYMDMLSKNDVEILDNIIESCLKNKEISEILRDAKFTEKVIIFDVEYILDDNKKVKLKCKAKIDLFTKSGYLVDLKTMPRLENTKDHIDNFRYDLQLAFYKHALESIGEKVKGTAIISLEKQPPYSAHTFELSNNYITRGLKGGFIYTREVRGWVELLKEMHFNPRPRFKSAITVLELME